MREVAGRAMAHLEGMAKRAKRDGIALYLAARDPRVSWGVKAFALLAAAYVLSPIDLIPDFIPVLGFLDELILLPLVVGIVVRFVEPGLMGELREQAGRIAERPTSRLGAAIILALWVVLSGWAAWALWRHFT